MSIHKRTKLTPLQQEEMYRKHHTEHVRVALLAEEYHASRPTIRKILDRGRKQNFSVIGESEVINPCNSPGSPEANTNAQTD